MNEVKNLMAPPLTEEMQKALYDARKKARARYGENSKITDGNYDKSLAVKCINGTFVGQVAIYVVN